MRADRLVAILLLLQTRGKITARDVADELEISERTARRDLDALAAAGLPVYSVQGRDGGWKLAGSGKTDLSGLSAAEVRALFLATGPTAASPEVRSALRKLIRALPEPFRPSAVAASEAILVDTPSWDQPRRAIDAPHLDAVQTAVVESLRLSIDYAGRSSESENRLVDPLGLAAKGPHWYLLAETANGRRTFRVDRIRALRHTGVRFTRPPGFSLADAWTEVVDRVDQLRTPLHATAWVDANAVSAVRGRFGGRVTIEAAGEDGRVPLRLRAHSVESLAAEVAGFGALVEITAPQAVRDHLAAIGDELVATYRTSGP